MCTASNLGLVTLSTPLPVVLTHMAQHSIEERRRLILFSICQTSSNLDGWMDPTPLRCLCSDILVRSPNIHSNPL
ncbi:hypothetical protein B0H19DRAFT_1172347 [Mycena capillaripes]|nr:hypothetical protein B0H19DRAFT_1172347 [Mycena capillaripes]